MPGDFDKEINDFNADSSSYYGVGAFLVEIVKIFAPALIIIIPIRVFLFQPFFVQGPSMESNFHDGEYLIVNEFGHKKTEVGFADFHFFTVNPFRDLHRGDVIVFRYPNNPSQFFIKRVIGLPGERIEIKGDKVTIYNEDNPFGSTLNEHYLDDNVTTSGNLEKRLGEKEYFVMGDNRNKSSDSRNWGTITDDHVIGKVLLRAWPFNEMKLYLGETDYTL